MWQWLVKIGDRLVKKARYYWLLPADSHWTWRCLGAWYVGSMRWQRRRGGRRRWAERNWVDREARAGALIVKGIDNKGLPCFSVQPAGGEDGCRRKRGTHGTKGRRFGSCSTAPEGPNRKLQGRAGAKAAKSLVPRRGSGWYCLSVGVLYAIPDDVSLLVRAEETTLMVYSH